MVCLFFNNVLSTDHLFHTCILFMVYNNSGAPSQEEGSQAGIPEGQEHLCGFSPGPSVSGGPKGNSLN